jgi:hypothetical protein
MTTKVNSSVLDFSTLNGYAPYLKVANANVSTVVTGLTSSNVTTALGSDPVQNATTAVNVTGLTSANVTVALGSDPVNVAVKVTGLTSANVTTALGADPVQNSLVAEKVTGLTSANVTTALGSDPVQNATTAVNITGLTYANVLTAISTNGVPLANVATRVTGLTSANVTTALGYTPISATSNVDTTTRSLGVGTAPSGTVGEIRAIDNITAYYSSDARLKTNVEDIVNAVTTVVSIGGKTFDWTDDYISTHGGEDGYFVQKSDFGVIAQDVEAVFPRAVRTRQDGMLAVDYEKLSALAFAAIKELSSEMQDLRAKIQELESKIAAKP